MNLRWLWLDYVDPQLGLSRSQRSRIFSRAHPMSPMKKPAVARAWWMPLLGVLSSVLSFGPLFVWVSIGKPTGIIELTILALLVFVVPWVATAWIGRYTWRPNVAAALRAEGFNVCAKCGYWLRGLGAEVKQCPECGTSRELMDSASATERGLP